MTNPISTGDRVTVQQSILFVLLLLISVLLFRVPLRALLNFALTNDQGTHIIFMLPLSLYFLYLQHQEISQEVRSCMITGLPLTLISSACAGAVAYSCVGSNCLSLQILTLVLVWISAFILIYGVAAFNKARFALLLLLLIVPIPDSVVDKTIFWLQAGSAAVSYWLLHLLGIPVMREGFILHLPALDLEVEKACSGIRSSLVLLVTTLVVGQFSLRSVWAKCILLLSIVPIVILKNGVRIVSIAMLSLYVNRAFLHGWLHKSGGIVFYLLGLLAMYPVLMGLRSLENRPSNSGKNVLLASSS
jgi:exosortase